MKFDQFLIISIIIAVYFSMTGCNEHQGELNGRLPIDTIRLAGNDYLSDSNNFVCGYKAPFKTGRLLVINNREDREEFEITDFVIDGRYTLYIGPFYSCTGCYDKCKKISEWKYFDTNGKVARSDKYEGDLLHGFSIEKYGNKSDTIIYNQGTLIDYKCSDERINEENKLHFLKGNGTLISFDFDSIEITTYTNGVKNGMYKSINNFDGVVSGNYVYGLKNGEWVYDSPGITTGFETETDKEINYHIGSNAQYLFANYEYDKAKGTWFQCSKDSSIISIVDYDEKGLGHAHKANGFLKYLHHMIFGPTGKRFDINDPSIRLND